MFFRYIKVLGQESETSDSSMSEKTIDTYINEAQHFYSKFKVSNVILMMYLSIYLENTTDTKSTSMVFNR